MGLLSKDKAALHKFHINRNSDMSLLNWVSYRSYLGVQETKMSFISIKNFNIVVTKSEVQFCLQEKVTLPSDHPYINIKSTNMAKNTVLI
jgi:hypothetical protein